MGSEEIAVSRRDFLGLSWRVIAALAAGQAGCFGLRFLASRKVEGMLGEVVTAGIVQDFPVGTITPFDTQRFFVVRFEDGGFLALHSKCTHLGCAVTWNERSGRFVCPCHGSEFDQHGDVLNPPAPTALDLFSVEIDDDGRVKVDTRVPIKRETVGEEVIVYPPPDLEPTPEEAEPAGE
ncbi:MAG: Rieske (2Fe-2S) protein [Chloroflexi bacterium]|nr:Rieske (2Fe-2S) protein [Chloroflexota bacterium]